MYSHRAATPQITPSRASASPHQPKSILELEKGSSIYHLSPSTIPKITFHFSCIRTHRRSQENKIYHNALQYIPTRPATRNPLLPLPAYPPHNPQPSPRPKLHQHNRPPRTQFHLAVARLRALAARGDPNRNREGVLRRRRSKRYGPAFPVSYYPKIRMGMKTRMLMLILCS